MCGVAAVRTAAGTGASWLRRVLEPLEHRGLACARYETAEQHSSGWTLGAHRLPIVAPALGRQPVRSPSGRYLVVLNAEVFNYAELATELTAAGTPPPVPTSDSSVLATAIQHWGPSGTVPRLDWEGVFIALDTLTGDLHAARDHLGIKPLYLGEFAGGTALASEVKGLVALPDCDAIRPVRPGTVLHLAAGRPGDRAVETAWWRPEDAVARRTERPATDAAGQLLDLLRSAVHARVPRDQDYAIALSGGLDSSLVLQLAVETGHPPTAYVLHRPGSADLPYARRLCHGLGVRLVEVSGDDSSRLRGALASTIRTLESWEWQVVNHAAPMAPLLSRIHADGHRVVLSGEGADELFLGYPRDADSLPPEAEQLRRVLDLHRTNCRRLDRMGMAYQLEFRVPFLDRAVTDWALSSRPDLLLREGRSKWILRQAAAKVLPADYADRHKLSLAKGAGYRYAPGDQPTVFGALGAAASGAEPLPERLENLVRFSAERVFLRHFLDNRYDKADYLLQASV